MKQLFYLLIVLLLPQLVLADVKLNTLFSDHMVVQRNTEIPIWGWADIGEEVSVVASWGEKGKVSTDANGTWKLKLKTPKAGGPYTITISGKNTIVINDVLSGEVWLCTGQSNMDFTLNRFVNDAREPQYQPLVEHIRKEIQTANDTWLRHIEVPQTTSLFIKKNNFKDNWRKAVPGQIEKISATGYFFAKELREKLKVPIGLVECSWSGTRIQPWISENAYLESENLREYFLSTRKDIEATIAKMETKNYKDLVYEKRLASWNKMGQKGRKPKPETYPKDNKQLPATNYNGMLSAVIPYAIKGAIWYQGESNAVYMPNEYEDFLTVMITSWRKEWGQGDFPFYMAQLASCKRGSNEADNGWATVNDKLRRTLKLPNTGLAVLHDIGEAKDIHPHNKMEVGKRLSLWALKHDYNKEVSAVSGPLYNNMQIKNNKIQVEFLEVGSGLVTANKFLMDKPVEVNEDLKTFEIVGENGVWKPAKAKIISSNKIEVWNASIKKPINVRYAWSGTPDGANLYNKDGLPAAVFSTEN